MVCTAFSIDPARASRLDARLVDRVLYVRAARQAVATFNDKNRTMGEAEATIFAELMDGLDALAESRGEPEE